MSWTPRTRPSAVLFDLDGTIMDSGPGIMRSVAHALAAVGAPVPGPEGLRRYIGPPAVDGFRALAGLEGERHTDAVRIYRSWYERHALVRENRSFPGMPGLVADLAAAEVPLAVATSKLRDHALAVLDHFGLTDRFVAVCGATRDGSRRHKDQIVEDALAALRAGGVDVSAAVMVGDREHDVAGAARWGLPCVCVTWGYGAPAEYARARAVATGVAELSDLLGLRRSASR